MALFEEDALSSSSVETNKPGTAQVGAISKAQKDSKTTFLQLETTKALKKLKIDKKNFRIFFRSFR